MVLRTLFGRRPPEAAARRLYAEIVAQARRPTFYEDFGVPDSLDGRFEMVALHTFLVLHRLKQEPGGRGTELGQAVFDTMFLDMDASLREMGAGDLGVGRRVKQMATGFYGRIAAYEAGLTDRGSGLSEALRRNLYGTVEPAPHLPEAMAAYVRAAAVALAAQPGEALSAGRVDFPTPSTIS